MSSAQETAQVSYAVVGYPSGAKADDVRFQKPQKLIQEHDVAIFSK